MANIRLTQSLLDTSLDNFVVPLTALGFTDSVASDIDSVIQMGGGFDSDPVISGNTYTYTFKNPSYFGEAGEYRFNGSVTAKYSSDNELISAGGSLSGATITSDDGILTLKGSVKAQITANKTSYSLSYSELAFAGNDGSAWSLKGSVALSYSYDSKTDIETNKYSVTISSISSTDSDKNNLTFSGSLKYTATTDNWSGYITTMSLTLDGQKLSATGLKLSYAYLSDITSLGTLAEQAPILFAGNDTITVSDADKPQSTVYGYTGNDKITGSSSADSLNGDTDNVAIWGNDTLLGGGGNDTLNGGGGTDLLTGGSGADVFVIDFSRFDFSSAKSVKIVTVSDFKSADGDQLQLAGFDTPIVVTNIKTLKGQTIDTSVIYETSTGKFWYDSDGIIGSGTPTLNFAKVVGVPADYFS